MISDAHVDPVIVYRVTRAMQYMRANLATTTLAGLATELGVSKWTVMRDFQILTKTTPGRMLAELRLGEMQRLLRETTAPIEVVVGLLGLKSVGTACRWFKLQTGTTPARYRLEARTQVAA